MTNQGSGPRRRSVTTSEIGKRGAEGLERFRRAAGLARDRGEPLLAVWLFHRAARELTDTASWPEADVAFEEIFRAQPGVVDTETLANLHRQWGDSLRARKDWPRAISELQRALALDE